MKAVSRERLRPWLLIVAAWSGVGLFSVAQIYLARAAMGHPPPVAPLLILELPVWAFWALATVPIVMLARRFPPEQARLPSRLLLHAAVAVVVSLVAVAFQTLWYQAFNPYPMAGSSVSAWFWGYFRQYFIVGVLIYGAVLGIYHALTHYVLYRERELEASRANAQLTEARLQALRMQLHPHFLFNTLNSVSSLLEDDPAEARRVLAQLAELLRASLRTDALHVIPLEEELRFVRRYLDIERIRFGDRLDVRVRIDPATRRAAIPSFLFQPLVENAIRHGIAHRQAEGRLWLSAERGNGSLVLHVMDNGPGVRGAVAEGIGLANTRRRLAELYGTAQTLALEDRPGGGVDVRVEIPFRTMESDG